MIGLPTLSTIGPWSLEAVGSGLCLSLSDLTSATSSRTPTFNRATFYPFSISLPLTIKLFWLVNGSAVAGNVDLGVYTLDGVKLVSTGAVAQSGTTAIQTLTLGTPYRLNAGSYMMGLSGSSGSARFAGIAITTALAPYGLGYAQVASAHPLPATVTFAAYTETQVFNFGLGLNGTM